MIYELFDSVVIFNRDYQVVFEGSEIKKLLDNFSVSLHQLINEKDTDDKNIQILKYSLDTLTENKKPISFTFPSIDEEFILFYPGRSAGDYFFLTLKDYFLQIIRIEHDLKERVKELRCLYNISKELDSHGSIKESFEKCVTLIGSGFQYPGDTIVNLRIGKDVMGDTSWTQEEVNSVLVSDIIANGKRTGEIKILLKQGHRFLEEEKSMIYEIAGKISRAVEAAEKTDNLEKQKRILLAKNEALLKLTDECNKQRQKLRTFFSAITDKIVVINRDYDIIMSNKESIGDSGKCYSKLFGLNVQCEKCPSLHTFETGQNYMFERENGDKYLTLRSYPITDENGVVDRVLEVCRDITVQKKMEVQMVQSYKLASLGKLVAGVAHEINNPNTFILGNLKIIQESFHDIFPILEKYRENNEDLKIARLRYDVFKDNISTLIEDMINGANRTKKIVSDLRNFAKKDEDTFTEDVDLNYIIKNRLTLTSKHVKKYAELEIELAEHLPVFKGNGNKLEQVILNLVINASEAVEGENGKIKIKTDFNEHAKEVLMIVEDNGIGIEESAIKNIFDPFFTTKRNKGGTGLGLSISYGIIKDHGGVIDVESKHGVGTKFTIRIPVK